MGITGLNKFKCKVARHALRVRGTTALIAMLVFQLVFSPYALANLTANEQACLRALYAIAEENEGWISHDQLRETRRAHGLKGVRTGNVYQCVCGNWLPVKNQEGKDMQCPGCGKEHDHTMPVHDGNWNGSKSYHINGIQISQRNFITDPENPRNIKPVEVKAPWKCASCAESNPFEKAQCAHCGAAKFEGTVQAVTRGDTQRFQRDEADHQGFSAVKPEPRVALQEPLPLPMTPEQKRRRTIWQGVAAATIATALGIGIANYDPPPVLDTPGTVAGKVVGREWSRDIHILKRAKDGIHWEVHKHYNASSKEGTDPKWPSFPKEFYDDADHYRIEYDDSYSLQVQTGGRVVPWDLQKHQYGDYQVDQKVELRLDADGTPNGLRRAK